MNPDLENERQRLQTLDETLPPNLPGIPKYMLELVRN